MKVILRITFMLLIFTILINDINAKGAVTNIDYKYLGNSASNDDHHGLFNETQGIANGDPRTGDPDWFFSRNIDDNRNTYIYKVPYTQHLAHNFKYFKRKIRLAGGSKVCEHVGDIDYHAYRNQGYIIAPYDNCGDGHARIAIFRASDINGSENVLNPWAVIDVSKTQGKGAPWVSVAPNGKIYSSAGSNQRSDMVFEYTVDWESIRKGNKLRYTDRALHLYDQKGKLLRLTYKQGGDFSTDGKRLFIVTGYERNTSKKIWVLKYRGNRFVLDHQSMNKKMPFKFETNHNIKASWRQEPQGISYFNMDKIRPYHRDMKKGQLHVVLLNNKITSSDSVWIKHYQEFNTPASRNKPITFSDILKEKDKKKFIDFKHVKGRCLDISGGKNHNKTNIQIYTCNGSKSQKWKWTKQREIKNIMGLCLDVAGGINANGTNIQLYKCNGSKSQKWRRLDKGRVQNIMGRCLDIVNGINANKTNVQLYKCKYVDAQQWNRR